MLFLGALENEALLSAQEGSCWGKQGKGLSVADHNSVLPGLCYPNPP